MCCTLVHVACREARPRQSNTAGEGEEEAPVINPGGSAGAYWMKKLLDCWAGGRMQMAWTNSPLPRSLSLARSGCLM